MVGMLYSTEIEEKRTSWLLSCRPHVTTFRHRYHQWYVYMILIPDYLGTYVIRCQKNVCEKQVHLSLYAGIVVMITYIVHVAYRLFNSNLEPMVHA